MTFSLAGEGDIFAQRRHERVLPKYLFYRLSDRRFRLYLDEVLNSSTINNLNSSIVNGFEIPVPPLSVQRQVVDILDRFDALTTSLTDGLPAEIEARRQQYEHYRDRLLDFPRKEVA